MRVTIDELEGIVCPKCGAENIGKKMYIKREADAGGPHNVCDCCGYGWPITSLRVAATLKDVRR